MSDYIKDMFIEVREKDETISPLTELEQMIEDVSKVLGNAVLVQEQAREGFSVRLSLPRLTPNESWGNPDSQSRKDIDRIFASITRKGTIKERIDVLLLSTYMWNMDHLLLHFHNSAFPDL